MLQGREEWDRYSSATLDLVDGGLNGENVPLTPCVFEHTLLQHEVTVSTACSCLLELSIPSSPWTPQLTRPTHGPTRPRFTPLGTVFSCSTARAASLSCRQTSPTSSTPAVRLLPFALFDVVTIAHTRTDNKRPTFFGCNVTDVSNGTYPLIVYIANAQATTNSFLTNTSTFKLDYSETEASSFLDVAHANAAQLGRDDQWPVCLSCALVDRTRQRANIDRSAACSACLNRYCYNRASAALALVWQRV